MWIRHMERGSRVWASMYATMLGMRHNVTCGLWSCHNRSCSCDVMLKKLSHAAYGDHFLSNTSQLHNAPPSFGTAHITRRANVTLVGHFPEWRGCWGCVDNDTDAHCCSGRGECRMGLCVCRGGAFGMDCAHPSEGPSQHEAEASPAAAAEATVPPGLRIYVHEMPFEHFQTWLAGASYTAQPHAATQPTPAAYLLALRRARRLPDPAML